MRLRWRRRQFHPARFAAVGVSYSFAFTLPADTDVYALADQLLREEVAQGANMPPSTKVRVNPNFRKALRNRQFLEGMTEIPRLVTGELKITAWARKYPRAAIYAMRHRLIRVNPFSRRHADRDALSEEAQAFFDRLKEPVHDIDKSIVDSTKVLGALTATDADLFSPIYLRKSPFVRLELRSFAAKSPMLADEEILATLLLHRSGVALMTFYTVVGSNRSADELLRSSISREALLETTTFPGTVIGAAEPAHEVDTDDWVEPNVGTVPDRRIKWASNFSITDAFWVYRDRIDWMTGKRSEGHRDYFCYTTVMVDGLQCCDDRSSWLEMHSQELAGLAMRVPSYGKFDAKTALDALPKDYSIYDTESRYYYGSNALIVEWDFTPKNNLCPSFVDMISTVAVVEHALLQYWQIHSLDDQLSISSQTGGELSRVQRRLAEGIEEYRASSISYGSAQEIADSIMALLRANNLHQRLLERLAMMQQLISAQQAQASVRRNYIIAGVGSMATVLLGIPAIKDSLAVISQWKPEGFAESLAGPIRSWAEGGPSAILSVYVGALCLIIALFVAGFAFQRTSKRSPKKLTEPGMEWTPMSPSWSVAKARYFRGAALSKESTGEQAPSLSFQASKADNGNRTPRRRRVVESDGHADYSTSHGAP